MFYLVLQGCLLRPVPPSPTAPSASQPQLDVGAYGDHNQTPIRAYYFGDPSEPEGVLVAGHADGRCCPLVSEQIIGVPDDRVDVWIGYGLSRMHADDPSGRQDLHRLVSSLNELAEGPTCKGQLQVYAAGAWSGWEEDGDQLSREGVSTMRSARTIKRPIMVYGSAGAGAPPLLVPLLAEDGTAVELHISDSVLSMPRQVADHFSLNGYAQYASWARKRVRSWQAVQLAMKRAKEVGGGSTYEIRGFEFTGATHCAQVAVDGAQGLREIDAALVRQSASNELTEALVTLGSLQGLNLDQDLADGRGVSAKLAELRRENVASLTACSHATAFSAVSGTVNRVSIVPAPPDPALLAIMTLDAGEVSRNLAQSQADLAEALAGLARSPPGSDDGPLVDAFLRGWPATYGEASDEAAFDVWMDQRRTEVWSEIGADLDHRGIRLQSGDDTQRVGGFLHRSNVIFQVSRAQAGWVATPYFVLAGDYLQVADPGAEVVRYEGALVDQHLVDMERARQFIDLNQRVAP